MSSVFVISHAELGETLVAMQWGISSSELHGALCGYLCPGGRADANTWVAALAIDSNGVAPDHQQSQLLQNFYHACCNQLDDPELGFEPLLPDSEQPLSQRADALVEWCHGFLGGLGLAGVTIEQNLSPDGAEILRDFSAIAGSQFAYDNTEEDENALFEVLEFIRVGVLLLHTELNTPVASGGTVH